MPLRDQIDDELKNAMRSGDARRRDALRLLTSALKQKEVDERKTLADTDVVAIIEKGSEYSDLRKTRSPAPVALWPRFTKFPPSIEDLWDGVRVRTPLALALGTNAKTLLRKPSLG